MNKIVINNNTYSGKNIVVVNGKVIIDGVDVTPDSKVINIRIDGDVNGLKVDSFDKMEVNGNVNGSISTTNGNIYCGDVTGSINTVNGDVECKTVGGSVSSVNGDISREY